MKGGGAGIPPENLKICIVSCSCLDIKSDADSLGKCYLHVCVIKIKAGNFVSDL